MTRTRTAVAAGFVVLAVLAGYYFYGGAQVPPGQPELTRLSPQNFSVLRERFNGAQQEVRLIALLSPT
ncbi:MAG: hypothetical protein L0387_38705 [Acidobacteria bacterium]|nr:hypothetical protein [Acidobacteriota bacterium]MCI0724852.1 hypothetical protein [Acidobacteriota bacterium]